jgi:hypothetical protein
MTPPTFCSLLQLVVELSDIRLIRFLIIFIGLVVFA